MNKMSLIVVSTITTIMNLLMKLVPLVLLLFLVKYIFASQLISIFLQKCYGTGNPKYCNFTTTCRPLNRTSKLSSTDVYFNPGLVLEAPIYMEIVAYKKFRTVYRQHMVKIKDDLCVHIATTKHPLFKLFYTVNTNGNFLDPCPLKGHRYIKPQVSTYGHVPFVPIGEWRLDFTVSKNIKGSEEIILSWSDFYEVKPTSATQF